MRVPNSSTVSYSPGVTPTDPEQFQRYVTEELAAIAAAIRGLAAGHLDKITVAPTKPRDGNYRYADGINWNPGSGEGFYRYNGTTWKFLG